jgi:hypothetical protein
MGGDIAQLYRLGGGGGGGGGEIETNSIDKEGGSEIFPIYYD